MASNPLGLFLRLWLLAVFSGCAPSGPELAPVTGRVMLDGQPLESADVLFQPAEAKRPSSGRTNADGRYQLMHKRGIEGALVGEHSVLITVSPEVVRNPPPIPPIYNTESTLHREVKAGEDNVFDLELTSKAR